MREILFRGKSIDLDKWVYGFYAGENCKYPWSPSIKQANIIQEGSGLWFEVAPETLGQYTGLTDKNGKKIFEGDILKISEGNDEDDYVIQKVYAYRGVLCVDYWTPDWDFNALAFLDNDNGYVFEIIGNVHDNPEQLGGDAGD